MEDDLLNLKKYPPVMYMDMYGNGNQCFEQSSKDNGDVFDVVFKAKYVRIDLALEKANNQSERQLKKFEEIKHDEFYEVLCNLINSENNAGWEERHSDRIDYIRKMMRVYDTEE